MPEAFRMHRILTNPRLRNKYCNIGEKETPMIAMAVPRRAHIRERGAEGVRAIPM
jgi:hypothetical protein